MSERYPGGIISKTAPVPTGPYENGTAPGIWTLDQQLQYKQQGIWPTAGVQPNYIEDVFSTWLYTGNGSTQTINNGIDLAGKGGLVWIKSRTLATAHYFQDTVRGANNYISSNATNANTNLPALNTVFNSDGFSQNNSYLGFNDSSNTYASWTFRKQPKFFDVVTYTAGSGPTSAISHNLGVVPGCIIMKNTSSAESWLVVHRGTNGYLFLNLTDARDGVSLAGIGANTSVAWVGATSTTIDFSNFWGTGSSYVAYLFAHDAGGFGLTGTDNVISCGSFTTDSGGLASVTLGYEPQWLLTKKTAAGSWMITDNMRGWATGSAVYASNDAVLFPNLSNAELTQNKGHPTATGFSYEDDGSSTYIYIAIRRGPMKVPTDGTKVFSPNVVSTDASAVTTNFPVDLSFESPRSGSSNIFAQDRLRGANKIIYTYNTDAESTAGGSASNFQSNTSVEPNIYGGGTSLIFWNFQRAPGFFDEVCYTGTGVSTTQAHNLGVVPELMFVKSRTGTQNWPVYSATLGNTNGMFLNLTNASAANGDWNSTTPTASVFSIVGTSARVNDAAMTYVAYLFATCPGVSKVGSYTGTGTTLQINCGFVAGARFVMIKRTDSTGGWYVWDSARGIVAGNDPYLLLNSTAAEVTGTDYVDTYSAGFEISSTAPAAINASGGTFIFLAIA